jgi:hypothetical protein
LDGVINYLTSFRVAANGSVLAEVGALRAEIGKHLLSAAFLSVEFLTTK